jgi:hypothetical protein
MKRLIAILLSVIYFATTSVASISLHYCGGKFQGFYINKVEIKSCCGKKLIKTNCCNNKIISIKSLSKHTIEHEVISKINLPTPIFSEISSYKCFNKRFSTNFLTPSNNAPPNLNKVSIYLKNRILLI